MVYRRNKSSLLYGCNGQLTHTMDSAQYSLFLIILVLMMFIAIHGNFLVIIAILKNKTLRIPRNAVLCSLAITDILSPFMRVLPIVITTIDGRWIFGCTWCVISSAMGEFLCAASILHLCVITFERYLSVIYPLRSKLWVTRGRIYAVLALIWSCAMMMGLCPFVTHIPFYFNRNIMICDVYLEHQPELAILLTSVYFCCPSLLMSLAYINIYREIVRNNRRIIRYEGNDGRRFGLHSRKLKQEVKAMKMVTVVIGMFFLLWLPYFTVVCLKSFHPNLLPSWAERGAITCAYMNSCVNFFIYYVMNVHFREALKKFLPFRRENNLVKNRMIVATSILTGPLRRSFRRERRNGQPMIIHRVSLTTLGIENSRHSTNDIAIICTNFGNEVELEMCAPRGSVVTLGSERYRCETEESNVSDL